MNTFTIHPADRVSHIHEYYFSRKLREVARLNAEDADIVSLGIGGPDRAPDRSVIGTLAAEARRADTHSYQPYTGLPQLRQSMAQWYRRCYDVELDPLTEVLPLIGSKEGVLHISLALLNPGDGVLIPDPGYPTYSSVSHMVGAEVHTYNLREDNGWMPTSTNSSACRSTASGSCGSTIPTCPPERRLRSSCFAASSTSAGATA